MSVYLDWNATTPPLESVLDAMREAELRAWGNPSSIHSSGRAARAVVEDARAAVGALMNADPRDILFTGSGTEANNLALRSAFHVDAAPSSGANAEPPWLVTSRLEHPSVARVAEALAREGSARVRFVGVKPSGVLDLEDLERAIFETKTALSLVTTQAVNHESGVIQPVGDVIALAHKAGARVHVDAVQAWGKLDTEVIAQADTASLAAHKIRGPKGIGALVARAGTSLKPVLLGGAQEKGLRPGTVSPSLAAGLGEAAKHALGGPSRYADLGRLRDALETSLLLLRDDAFVAGEVYRRAPHVSLLVWPGWQGAELVAALDLEGVQTSSGSACSAGTVEPSPVLAAMHGERLAASGLRLSLGETTTDNDVVVAVSAFKRVMAR